MIQENVARNMYSSAKQPKPHCPAILKTMDTLSQRSWPEMPVHPAELSIDRNRFAVNPSPMYYQRGQSINYPPINDSHVHSGPQYLARHPANSGPPNNTGDLYNTLNAFYKYYSKLTRQRPHKHNSQFKRRAPFRHQPPKRTRR